jgi:hypothetical protein
MKKTTAALVFASAALVLGACGPDEYEDARRAVRGTSELIYTYDGRTKLCFAAYDLGTQWGTMTNVPCTEEVGRLIGPQFNAPVRADGLRP